MRLRTSFIWSSLITGLGILFFSIPVNTALAASTSTLITSNTSTLTLLPSIVRLDLVGTNGSKTPIAAGALIDKDGRILTTYSAIQPLLTAKGTKLVACNPYSEILRPGCGYEAILLKTDSAENLALLQVRNLYINNATVSVEEQRLRNKLSFHFVSFDKTTTTEAVNIGEAVSLYTFPTTASSSVMQRRGVVTGFSKKLINSSSTAWLVSTDIPTSKNLAGGPVFNAKNQLLGLFLATDTANPGNVSFLSLATLNRFLKSALGTSYLSNQFHFDADYSLVGQEAGLLKTSLCPASASPDPISKTCRCNPGFFAVGNACLLGNTYCSLVYPKGASYDLFLKQCVCPKDGNTTLCPEIKSTFLLPVPTKQANATTTKPAILVKPAVTSTSVIIPTSTKPIVTSTSTKPTVASTTKVIAPIFTIPKNFTELYACPVIGQDTTKYYYMKGQRSIKHFTYTAKRCYKDEASAKAAGYKKYLGK